MKSKDQQLLEEAYSKINEMHNDQNFVEHIAEEMFNIGSRINSGLKLGRIRTDSEDEAVSLKKDAQFLIEHAQEIEQMASNVLGTPEREISEEEDEQMIVKDLNR